MNNTEIISVVILLAGAAVSDLLYGRISNKYIAVGLLTVAMEEQLFGGSGLVIGLKCLVVCLAVYPLYMIGALGAGDVKLFTVLGCIMSWQGFFRTVYGSLVIAAIIGLGLIAKDKFCHEKRRKHIIRFAPCIFISYLIEILREFVL